MLSATDRRPADPVAHGEVVLVVRPEDIEVASTASELSSRAFATGHLHSIAFGGQSERLTIQLEHGSGVEPAVDGEGPVITVEATRSAREQLALPLTTGRRVALGIRRLHALPTPISSFHVHAVPGPATEALVETPLLAQLIRSMQARTINIPVDADATLDARDLSGVVVVPGSDVAVPQLVRLARAGARRLLCLPARAPLPTRVLVKSDSDRARPDLLALVSSVLRHLPVEASFVSVRDPGASPSGDVTVQRQPLDALTASRGSDRAAIRTDGFAGDTRDWVRDVAAGNDPALVILGLRDTVAELERRLNADYMPFFTRSCRCPVLLALSTPDPYEESATVPEPAPPAAAQ